MFAQDLHSAVPAQRPGEHDLLAREVALVEAAHGLESVAACEEEAARGHPEPAHLHEHPRDHPSRVTRRLVVESGRRAAANGATIQRRHGAADHVGVHDRVGVHEDQAIVKTWPVRFRTERALAMGFRADADFESVVRGYLESENVVPA